MRDRRSMPFRAPIRTPGSGSLCSLFGALLADLLHRRLRLQRVRPVRALRDDQSHVEPGDRDGGHPLVRDAGDRGRRGVPVDVFVGQATVGRWPSMFAISAAAGALLGAIVAAPAIRLRGVYFALLTFGLVELFRSYASLSDYLGLAYGLFGASSFVPERFDGTHTGSIIAYYGAMGLLAPRSGRQLGDRRRPAGLLLAHRARERARRQGARRGHRPRTLRRVRRVVRRCSG